MKNEGESFQTLRHDINHVDQKLDKFMSVTNTRFNKVDSNIAKLAELILRSEENRVRDRELILNKVEEEVSKITILYENSKDETKLVAEGHGILSHRIDDHEERISRLEKRA